MKNFLTISWILAALVSGCASSPPSPTVNTTREATPEKALTTVSGTDENVLILRQPDYSKSGTYRDWSKRGQGKKPDSDATAAVCPPGQLMATRVISGETGTRISEECVTPFSSKGRRFSANRPVAIKVRNGGGGLKAQRVTTK